MTTQIAEPEQEEMTREDIVNTLDASRYQITKEGERICYPTGSSRGVGWLGQEEREVTICYNSLDLNRVKRCLELMGFCERNGIPYCEKITWTDDGELTTGSIEEIRKRGKEFIDLADRLEANQT